MKTMISPRSLSGFLSGLFLGISVAVLFAFTYAPTAPDGGNTPVSAAVANAYYKNYMSGAVRYDQVMKGFSVDRSQLDAMNSILSENTALKGFRIYFGKDKDAKRVALVVGVNPSGDDAVTNTIYSTAAQISDPCPPVCDAASPIIRN